ncbi:retrovirus-related Pol polyprotein from transposon 17.6 [Trichonephila clavipes]|nr:retrovirus-related Pol polyprotein from transposon 17.6 [Trichonephila clavipes]
MQLNSQGISRELFKKAKRKLEVATHKAKLTSDVKQGSYAKYYNRQNKHREFAPGDQVLVLIPDSANKLYARWTGPVKVVKRVKPNSYYLQMAGGNLRLMHVNKIREYRTREFKRLELFMILMMNSVRYMKRQQFLQLRRMTKHWTE